MCIEEGVRQRVEDRGGGIEQSRLDGPLGKDHPQSGAIGRHLAKVRGRVRFQGFAAVSPGVLIEASGGVTLQRIRTISAAGADLISVGALTHSARALDLALDFDE